MAFGPTTVTSAAGAVSDLFSAQSDLAKQQGDLLEYQNYQLAANLATQNAQFTEWSTNIKQAQDDRNLFMSLGATKAAVAGSGLAESGSAEDILAQSAREGAITRAVAGEQGLITEAGYKEQAQSYETMSQAALVAANAEGSAAIGADVGAMMKGVAAVATLV